MCGLTFSPLPTAFFASRPAAEQHARVGGVGARRDRRDQHVAVGDRHVMDVDLALRLHQRAVGRHLGKVRAAPAGPSAALPSVRPRVPTGNRCSSRAAGWLNRSPLSAWRKRRELLLHVADLDAVLRALGSGKRRRHRRQVERQHRGVIDRAGLRHAEQALCAEVRFERGDLVRACGPCPRSRRLSSRPPGRSPSSRRTRAPCSRSSHGRATRAWPFPRRRTRRTCRPPWPCAASR